MQDLSEEFNRAFGQALRYLARRPRSEREVADFLVKKTLSPEVVDATIQRLEEEKLINDDEFVQWWIEQRQNFKKKSQLVIKQELLQKGVDSDIIERNLNKHAEDDKLVARMLFNKQAPKYKNLSELEFKKKMMGFMQRRGYSFGIVNELLKEYFNK